MLPTSTNYTAAFELKNDGTESSTFSARDDLKRTHLLQSLPMVSPHDVASASHSGDTHLELSTTKDLYKFNANAANGAAGTCTSSDNDTHNSTISVGRDSTNAHSNATKPKTKQLYGTSAEDDNVTKLTQGINTPVEHRDETDLAAISNKLPVKGTAFCRTKYSRYHPNRKRNGSSITFNNQPTYEECPQYIERWFAFRDGITEARSCKRSRRERVNKSRAETKFHKCFSAGLSKADSATAQTMLPLMYALAAALVMHWEASAGVQASIGRPKDVSTLPWPTLAMRDSETVIVCCLDTRLRRSNVWYNPKATTEMHTLLQGGKIKPYEKQHPNLWWDIDHHILRPGCPIAYNWARGFYAQPTMKNMSHSTTTVDYASISRGRDIDGGDDDNGNVVDYPVDVPLLIDSGTMYDTFDHKVRPHFSKYFYEGSEIPLNTGNGRTIVRDRINVHYPLLGVTSANVVLKNGLSTCSEGKRVMVDGFIKVWAPNHKPLFIGPDRVNCIIPRLHNRMAYLDTKTITTTIDDVDTIFHECGVKIKDGHAIIPLKAFGRSVKLRSKGRHGEAETAGRTIKRRKLRKRGIDTAPVDVGGGAGSSSDTKAGFKAGLCGWEPPELSGSVAENSDASTADSANGSVFDGDEPADIIANSDGSHESDPECGVCNDVITEPVSDRVLNSKLRAAAMSREHLLDHIPFNRYCKGCVDGKTKNKARKTGAFAASGRKCSEPGDIVSFDQCKIAGAESTMGIGGYTKALDIMDVATGLAAMYPIEAETEIEIANVLSNFIGETTVKLAYTDGYSSLRSACQRIIGVNRINNFLDTTPGRPDSNPIIERQNYLLCDKMRAVLITAGLPICFWSSIAMSVSFQAAIKKKFPQKIDDTTEETELVSSYRRWHGKEPSDLQPFIIGQLVSFLPAPTAFKYDSKAEARLRAGVFMGYHLGPSMRWTGQYRVILLDDLMLRPISEKADRKHFSDIHIHRTEVVRNAAVKDEMIEFPLRRRYHDSKYTLAGLESAAGQAAADNKDVVIGVEIKRYGVDSGSRHDSSGDGPGPSHQGDNTLRVGPEPKPLVSAAEKELSLDIEQLQPTDTEPTIAPTIDKAASLGIETFTPARFAESADGRRYEVDEYGKRKINWVHRIVRPDNVTEADWRLSAKDVGLRAALLNITPEEMQRRIDKTKGGPIVSDEAHPTPVAYDPGSAADMAAVYILQQIQKCKNQSCKLSIRVDTANKDDQNGHCCRRCLHADSRGYKKVKHNSWCGGFNHCNQDSYKDNVVQKREIISYGVNSPQTDVVLEMMAHPPAEDLDSCRLKRKPKRRKRKRTIWECADESKTISDINHDFMQEMIHESDSEASTVACITDDDEGSAKSSTDTDWDRDMNWTGLTHEQETQSWEQEANWYSASRKRRNKKWSDGSDEMTRELQRDEIPAMPKTATSWRHRHRAMDKSIPVDMAVARPVTKGEWTGNAKAEAAYEKEWANLKARGVIDETRVRSWKQVAREAQENNTKVHFGFLFGFMVEKNAELREIDANDPRMKFKYRVVFRGDDVRNEFFDVALFQDLGSSTSSMDASRAADAYGCMPGHGCQQADAEQAYLQAEFPQGAIKTWVVLPKDQWGPDWDEYKDGKPCVPLLRPLYGHPHAGAHWDAHAEERLRTAGFEQCSEAWPSVYFHETLQLILVRYVDDFKMAGPSKNLDAGWRLLTQDNGIELGDIEPPGLFLGCKHEPVHVKLKNGNVARGMRYNSEAFLRDCVSLYCELAEAVTGKSVRLTTAYTPSVQDNVQKTCPAAAPAHTGPCARCPWCHFTFPKSEFDTYKDAGNIKYTTAPKAEPKPSVPQGPNSLGTVHKSKDKSGYDSYYGKPNTTKSFGGADDEIPDCAGINPETVDKLGPASRRKQNGFLKKAKKKRTADRAPKGPDGQLGKVASRVLMKILYGARYARFDLLYATNHLACHVSKWDEDCDKALHRLVSYIDTTYHYRQVGYVGDDQADIGSRYWSDASFAACPYSQRSTSGIHHALFGPNTLFSQAAQAKRQTAMSTSSTESEAIAGFKCIKEYVIPGADLYCKLLNKPDIQADVREDNKAFIHCVQTGRNPTMKPLHRVHRVSIGYLHERLADGLFNIEYEDTNKMAADAYTKGFTDATKWRSLLPLIGIYDPGDPGSMPSTEIASITGYDPTNEPQIQRLVAGGGKSAVSGEMPAAGTVQSLTRRLQVKDFAKSNPTDHAMIQPTTPTQEDSRLVFGPSATQIEHNQQKSSSTTNETSCTEGRLTTDNTATTTELMVPKTHVPNREQDVRGTHTQLQDVPNGAINECNDEDASAEAWNKSLQSSLGVDFAPLTHFARSTGKNGRRFCHNPLVAKDKSLPKRFIEVCCHEQSTLSKQFELAGDWEVIRITKDDNILKHSTVQRIVDAINCNTVVWFSPECTGGCSWNYSANANKSPATTALIQGKQRIFSRIWGNFKVITHIAKTCGAQVYWETTTSNAYRQFTYVKETMEKYQFTETHFDGCMFGQMHPIKTDCCATKPWTILHLNNNNFPAKMMRQNSQCRLKCNKQHRGDYPHEPIVGSKATLASGYYSVGVATAFFNAITC